VNHTLSRLGEFHRLKKVIRGSVLLERIKAERAKLTAGTKPAKITRGRPAGRAGRANKAPGDNHEII
jgi:hypothetical protein